MPEPDYVFYGQIIFGARAVTGADTEVVVEARKTATGPVVAAYSMGSQTNYGDYYSLRLPLEAFLPLIRSEASRLGGLVYLTVRDGSGVRVQKTTSIATRGKLVRLDFIEPDSDGDGLPDGWEQRYFASATAGDANADLDGDGRSNLQEFLDGTNPLVADGRHPADLAPTDNVLTFQEVNHYTEAWLAGQVWTKEPTNIPIAYVTRAAFLWVGGESYIFTNSPPTNAPLWWVNVPPLLGPAAGSNYISSTLPESLSDNLPLQVNLNVAPAEVVQAHAVEDQIPEGWAVLDISHGGNFDAFHHKVKWGPFYDNGERELYYWIRPPYGASGEFTFAGAGSFDGLDVAIVGVRSVVLSGLIQPLRFVACEQDAQGPKFSLAGEPFRSVVVEVSTNLVNWSPLETLTTDAQGAALFRPQNPALGPCRFYRLRIMP